MYRRYVYEFILLLINHIFKVSFHTSKRKILLEVVFLINLFKRFQRIKSLKYQYFCHHTLLYCEL